MSGPRLALLVLKTGRMAELCSFYRAIGVELVAEKHGASPEHFAGRVGDLVLEIYPLPAGVVATEGADVRLGFAVNDLREVLEAIDVPVVSEPGMTAWGYRAVVRDPDGRAVEFYQR